MANLPTGTVTFLFTDIEGSTRRWDADPGAMGAILRRHDELLRQVVEAHEGHVFKTVGDAFCVAFSTADAALLATVAAQRLLHSGEWESTGPLRVRMAVHTGAVEERDFDYFGPTLNRVARILSLGHGGQILVSQVSADLLADALPEEVGLRDLGTHRLKDLQRPEQVYQVFHPDLPTDFPPLRALGATPNNLPQQLSSFIGREAEVVEVKRLLATTRLLTLAGAGGLGKTRLSLQVAADVLEEYADGVWLVELAALSDPALVPQAAASALGIREEPGRDVTQTLLDSLSRRSLLLVLDNCEHLVAACARLAEGLLRGCPQIRILATSREALGIGGETVWRIPPLSLPASARPGPGAATDQEAAALTQFDAVRLFVERAVAATPSFTVTNANAPAVAQLCHQLDGIPMAIELAAARIKVLAVEQIAARLDDRFRLLTGGSRTALPRQQTLRALVDWSHDLLSEGERALLRRLAAFAGGWTLEAAEHICAGEGIEDFEVLDLLLQLVDKSLVVVDEREGAEARYRFLQTIRQYARDRLVESGEDAVTRGRHLDYFLGLAEGISPRVEGVESADALSRLETEHDNFRAALAWSEHASDGADAGCRLAGALWRFWFVRGYWREGCEAMARVLRRSESAPAARAGALCGATVLMAWGGRDPAQAEAWGKEAKALCQAAGHGEGTALALVTLGLVAWRKGDYSQAILRCEEGLSLARSLGHPWLTALALVLLGDSRMHQGEHDAAREMVSESLALFERVGHPWGRAVSLRILALLELYGGGLAAAKARAEESLALARGMGDRSGIAIALWVLGLEAIERGNRPEGTELLREGLRGFHDLGDPRGIAQCLEALARALEEDGHPEAAARLLGSAEALREAAHAPPPAAAQEAGRRVLDAIRSAVGEARLAAAFSLGRATPLDDAITYALAPVDAGAARASP